VARVDALVGKLVAAAGPGAWVALTSDHGESLWEGGEREHGVLLGPSATRVPLILRPPGGLQGAEAPAARPPRAQVAHRPAGQDLALDLDPVPDAPRAARVEEGPVSLLDLAPTLAALAGASLPGAAGQDLGPALRGQPIEARPALSETWYPWFHFGWSPLFAVQTAGGRWESDLAGLGALPAEPAAALQPWSSEAPERPGPLSAEASAALEALGYLSSPAAGGSLAEAPDPRVRVGLLTELHAAESIEDPAARSRALQALVARAPELSDAHISWSLAEAARGDLPAAIRITEEVLERWPEHPTALVNLGLLARQAGEGERALDCARRLQALNPRDARGYRLEAAVMVDREDAAGVLRATEAGLKVAPEDPNLSYLAAIAELQAGDAARAGQLLEVARDAGTAADDVELWLGVAAEKQGRVDLALKYYDAASRRLVGDVRPWLRAGLLLQEAGRCEEAMPWLVNASKRGAGRDPGLAAAVAQCRAALRTPR
jgi:tetratricopeptide (TPR) repeat protein